MLTNVSPMLTNVSPVPPASRKDQFVCFRFFFTIFTKNVFGAENGSCIPKLSFADPRLRRVCQGENDI